MIGTPDPCFIVNVNPDGLDVLHRNPREECNTDAAEGRQTVDPDTADALYTMGEATHCQHCWPKEN